MSSVIENFKEPITWAFVVLTVVLYFVFELFMNNQVLSGFFAVLAGGAAYLIYNDIQEKQKLESQEEAKTADLLRRKKEQAKVEEEEGKCISCLAKIPQGAKECPNCGYDVEHYRLKQEQSKE